MASDSFYEEFIEYYDGNNKMTYEFLPQIGIFNGGADMMSWESAYPQNLLFLLEPEQPNPPPKNCMNTKLSKS